MILWVYDSSGWDKRWIFLMNSQIVSQPLLHLNCYNELVRCALFSCLMQILPIMKQCLMVDCKLICITDCPRIRGYIFGSNIIYINVLWRLIISGNGNDIITHSGPSSTTFLPIELKPGRSPNKSVKSLINNIVFTLNENGKIKSSAVKIPYDSFGFTLYILPTSLIVAFSIEDSTKAFIARSDVILHECYKWEILKLLLAFLIRNSNSISTKEGIVKHVVFSSFEMLASYSESF